MITTNSRVTIDENTVAVGLGEMMVTGDPAMSLACFGLGSCICLCAYDPKSRVAGMAHIVLPQSSGGVEDEYATKYADIAVPRLIEDMVRNGASKARLIVKLVGGAQMIQSVEFSDILEMGNRNLEMTKKALAGNGVGITASETGGNSGRSVWMFVDSGKVMVRKAGEGAREL